MKRKPSFTDKKLMEKRKKKRALSIVGIGSSGRSDVAEKHEEFLWPSSKPSPRAS